MNDIYKHGDLDKNEKKASQQLLAIASALEEYYGQIYSFISLTNDVHTVGAYPEVSRKIIALLALAELYDGEAPTEGFMTKADKYRKQADALIEKVQMRRVYLRNPDGTYVSFRDSEDYRAVDKTGSFGVLDSYDEEVFDN